MKTTGKIICWLLGIVVVIMIGVYLLDSRPKFPPTGDDWLTEWEAYEDQMARTGMDGGALATTGLRIRDPRDVCREEEYYMPDRYAIRNGGFKTLESGEEIYVRYADGLQRRSVWVHGDKCYFVDESGCKAHDIYAFDGFYAGADGSWDMDVPRLTDETRAVNGKRYREEKNPGDAFLQFDMADDGTGYVQRVRPAMGIWERYRITPFGRGTYALQSVTDSLIRAHLALLPDGRTALLSQAGETCRFAIQD